LTIKNYKIGDRQPYVYGEVKDSTGTIVNLSGASAMFRMITNDSQRRNTVSGNATITDATNGLLEYRWGTGDLSWPGEYLGEFEINLSGGEKMTLPSDDTLYITVRDDYD